MQEACCMDDGVRKRTSGVRQRFGRLGERLAAGALEQRGYRIVERNFRCRAGEMDLVAEEGQDLVFVEVKTRRGAERGLPEEAVDGRKARKLQEIAYGYLEKHNLADCSWRIDVVAVQFSSQGKFEEIRIYQHAITAS
jgi:putative endonuclease